MDRKFTSRHHMNAVELAAKMSYRDPSREGKLYTYLTPLGHCNAT
ncbi:hypothetical protein [Methanobacterium ferruginis]|nr:hypothetical protein [Methanobacterium ferruginis]